MNSHKSTRHTTDSNKSGHNMSGPPSGNPGSTYIARPRRNVRKHQLVGRITFILDRTGKPGVGISPYPSAALRRVVRHHQGNTPSKSRISTGNKPSKSNACISTGRLTSKRFVGILHPSVVQTQLEITPRTEGLGLRHVRTKDFHRIAIVILPSGYGRVKRWM